MAKHQKGWVTGGYGTVGRFPIRRLSCRDARDTMEEGGRISINPKTGAAEVIDSQGYAIGFITKAQVESLD